LVRLPCILAEDLLEADAGVLRAMRGVGAAMERTDTFLRQWPVAGSLLVGLVIALFLSTPTGR
jgi:hypothetical protein